MPNKHAMLVIDGSRYSGSGSIESRFIIPTTTEHVLTSAWLAEVLLGAHVGIEGQRLVIHGVGFWPNGEWVNR